MGNEGTGEVALKSSMSSWIEAVRTFFIQYEATVTATRDSSMVDITCKFLMFSKGMLRGVNLGLYGPCLMYVLKAPELYAKLWVCTALKDGQIHPAQ